MLLFFQSIVQYAFETADTDHSGQIDIEEFEAWYKIRTGNIDTIKVRKLRLICCLDKKIIFLFTRMDYERISIHFNTENRYPPISLFAS